MCINLIQLCVTRGRYYCNFLLPDINEDRRRRNLTSYFESHCHCSFTSLSMNRSKELKLRTETKELKKKIVLNESIMCVKSVHKT